MNTRFQFVAVASLLSCFACEPRAEAAPAEASEDAGAPLEGVWRVVETSSADPTVSRLADPPGLYIFTPTHYSMMYVIGQLPRPGFAAVDPTDAEKLTAYDTFIANTGTYEVTGDAFVTSPVVAKHPNFMGGGRDQYRFRTLADTLWLTSNGGPTSVLC
jgi:hypothetical protein